MTAFVILAAGAGSRSNPHLHKALLPLDGRAVISHQIALAPWEADIIICIGSKGQQIQDYMSLAHPARRVQFVHVPDWDKPGGGPGASLLAARDAVATAGGDMIFTSCDTLWDGQVPIWGYSSRSWAGVAPVPEGTSPERWTRFAADGSIYDKREGPGRTAYTGLAMIKQEDLADFWAGIDKRRITALLTGGELQVTGGLIALNDGRLTTKDIPGWIDTGDAKAYEKAIIDRCGYDWSKPDEATYVLPEEGRVVKFKADTVNLRNTLQRHRTIQGVLPELIDIRENFFSSRYVEGKTAYQAAKGDPDLILRLLPWAEHVLWKPVPVHADAARRACDQFYGEKTLKRVQMLKPELQSRAWNLLGRVNWAQLCLNCQPVTYHGDFNFGNIIVTYSSQGWDGFKLIDWRADFAGKTLWGDKRYDIAKLIAGLYVNWEEAQRGDFGVWWDGLKHMSRVDRWFGGRIPQDILTIAALTLLNSAPLHKHPLDELLVETAAEMLEVL